MLQILTELNLNSPPRVWVTNTPNSSASYTCQSDFILTKLLKMFEESSNLQENV